MFISTKRAGYDRGEQVASGRFLMLMQCSGLMAGEGRVPCSCPGERWEGPTLDGELKGAKGQIRAIVRFTSLRQLGHWMMGTLRVGKVRVTVSGSYGSDGLPKTVPHEVFAAGVPVPAGLVEVWNTGGGWNGAGSEAEAMRAFGKAIDAPVTPEQRRTFRTIYGRRG